MNGLSVNQPAMSSREISSLTNKAHGHVKRDIEVMLAQLDLDVSKFGRIYTDSKNRKRTEYLLPKNETLCLLTGYSPAARMKVITRWQELESKNLLAVPDFSNPAEAARAWADQYERRLSAERTKAEIGSRREATAMNTASQAVKKANRLECQLDKSKQYISIKRMSMIHHGQPFNWRDMKYASVEMGLPPIDVFDQNYGTVKAYHADVWLEVYGVSANA